MHDVYVLRSERFPDRVYVGVTRRLRVRLEEHDRGHSGYTARLRPWKLVVFVGFQDSKAALEFERYLKSGSGRAFTRRHFLGPAGENRDGESEGGRVT